MAGAVVICTRLGLTPLYQEGGAHKALPLRSYCHCWGGGGVGLFFFFSGVVTVR